LLVCGPEIQGKPIDSARHAPSGKFLPTFKTAQDLAGLPINFANLQLTYYA
jgi:hypothetical protein